MIRHQVPPHTLAGTFLWSSWPRGALLSGVVRRITEPEFRQAQDWGRQAGLAEEGGE
ncbi:MAG TPA: hypothetical protein VGS58_07055 [Candidatus Sulfopaludibacter sp.]|nr:hypothetical protein [Candidatus Sulfopaludibacter sp.]